MFSSIFIQILVIPVFSVYGASVFDAFSSSLQGLFTQQEEAPFILEKKTELYEERSYKSLNWVCAPEVPIKSSSRDQTEVFLKLFSYLEGENSKKVKIEMSIPVMIRYQKLKKKSPTVAACFFVGGEFQAKPPVPTNSNLTIFQNEPMTIVTRKFGGFVDRPSEWLTEATSLVRQVTRSGVKVRRDLMYWTAYDSPVKFWNRRNEVWLIKRT